MTGKRERAASKAVVFLIPVVAGVGIGLIGLAVYNLTRPSDFQPLVYETVSIVNVADDGTVVIPQVDGYEAPSINASDDGVPFLMARCSDAPDPVSGVATTWFVSEDTGNRYQFTEDGTQFDIDPGCFQIRFELEMPRLMIQEVNDQDGSRGSDAVQFHVEGEFDIDGGQTAVWASEAFLVIDDDPVIPADD